MNATREAKPFCSEHLGEHPYVQELRHKLKLMDREAEQIKLRGASAAKPDGLLAGELMIRLVCDHGGSASVDRLSREVQRKRPVVAAIFLALAKRGTVVMGRTQRGTIIITVPVAGRFDRVPQEQS